MLHTIVVYVENKPGVVSRMTIVTEADEDQARRIVANVYKLVNVLLVDDVTHHPALLRDLALVKVAADRETRSKILELATVFRARVLDIATDSITVELTGGEEKVDRLLELLNPFGLMEVVRTGIVAMRRGEKSPSVPTKRKVAGTVDDGTVSYSV